MLKHAFGALALALALCLGATSRADDPFLRRTTTVRVVEKVGPAVVNITTEQLQSGTSPFALGGAPFFDPFFRDFFEPRLPRKTQSLGSGVVIDSGAHVLTNEHVVRQATRIQVSLADGRDFEAELVGADPNNDIAVLKIETDEKLPWIDFGTSSDLMVGEPVIAIGNPFGLSSTVTTGVISALDRSIRTGDREFNGFLQTDASINPGNSGGPLLNAKGELVGINSAIYQGAEGIGFAIPIDTARRVVSDLIAHGEVTPVWLGLEFQNLDVALAEALHLPDDSVGALVNRVREDSPAERAGLRRGDVVTHLDRHPVRSARSFFEMLETTTVGQELEVKVWRDGEERTMTVRAERVPDDHIARLAVEMLGMELSPLDGGGYRVESVRRGSGAERIGVRAGDLILGINGRVLSDGDALRRAVLELRGRSRAMVVVQRSGGRYHVAIPLV